MKHLRQYIRQILLTEAAKGPQDLPEDTVVSVASKNDGYYIHYAHADDPASLEKFSGRQLISTIGGGVEISEVSPEEASGSGVYKEIGPLGNCGGALVVVDSGAEKGWGPLLYDVAIEYATIHGGGLISDRGVVSPSAHKVWDYYLNNRSDVKAHQLDDPRNTLTPTDEDNCDQEVAGGFTSMYSRREEPENPNWMKSPLSKRYTKEPTTINTLKAAGKLVIL